MIGKIGRYDERSVLLLDDSPFKATEQPWSQIVVPEYDKPEYQSAMAAARTADLNKEDVSLKKGMDTALLAAVGILEAMAHQVNVPAWVRRGGINAPTGPEVDTSADVTLDSLPSASTFEHWFNNTKTRGYWVEAGKAALKRKHIELAHGISYPANDPKDSAKTKPVISRHSANVTRQSLTDLSENENTTAEQRAVLLRALDVMADLGFGPSTRSKPTETVPETHTTQAREDPDPTPVANASSTETTVAKPKAKSKKIQPPTKAQVKEARAAAADRSRNIQLVERAHRSGEFDPANVSFSLPIASRPAKPVLKFLRALTMDSYHTLKEQVETLKTRLDRAAANANANMSEQQHEGRRARLADLLERLDLIVVLPDSPEYPSMVYMYGILPQHEEPPTHPQDVGRNRKRQRQE